MVRNIKIWLVTFLFIAGGCHTVRIPQELSIKSAPQYQFFQEQEGLKIAVDLFHEEERLKTFFSEDLISYGILPILIVVENHHPKSGYLLEKRNIAVSIKESASERLETREGSVPMPQVDGIRKSGAVLGLTGAIVGPLFLVIPGIIMMESATIKEIDFKHLNEIINRKSFMDKTIFPGESHSGFVYIQVKDRQTAQDIKTILIKTKNILSQKDFNFVIQIK